MPIYLRNFYVQQLVNAKKEEKAQHDKASRKAKVHKPYSPPKSLSTPKR